VLGSKSAPGRSSREIVLWLPERVKMQKLIKNEMLGSKADEEVRKSRHLEDFCTVSDFIIENDPRRIVLPLR
jgi:hypothetical protein